MSMMQLKLENGILDVAEACSWFCGLLKNWNVANLRFSIEGTILCCGNLVQTNGGVI